MLSYLVGNRLSDRHRGPTEEAKTTRARPPISAERTTFASATTALGSEIG
jgi:hypothetical protein